MSKYEVLLTIGWILAIFIGLLAFAILWMILKGRISLAEIVNKSALSQERIAKDQEEIEQLKMETRALLKQLHVA